MTVLSIPREQNNYFSLGISDLIKWLCNYFWGYRYRIYIKRKSYEAKEKITHCENAIFYLKKKRLIFINQNTGKIVSFSLFSISVHCYHFRVGTTRYRPCI